ncbi:MAG: hypothetical protein MJZ16_07700 [Bacteroidales bacterium]|nr:hypothetical protein [Bacteroidales bacterium]
MLTKSFHLLSALFAAGILISCSSGATFGTKSLDSWQFSKDEQSWENVTVPHSYNCIDGHTESYYRGKGYYTTSVKLSSAQTKEAVKVLFEGAAQAATVYVNGHKAAYHKGGYTPFYVDITPYVVSGKNTITVECDNTEDINLAPVQSDFNKNGGLHNPVTLLTLPKTHICTERNGLKRIHISTPEVSPESATIVVEAHVHGDIEGHNAIVTVMDASGKKCFSEEVEITDKNDIIKTFTLSNPHLWNGTEDPYLYSASVELKKDGKVTDKSSARFGVRTIEMDYDKGFILNGKPYSLRGTSIHQDIDLKASALTKEDYINDYKVVKELGCNFVRLAHYPHNDLAFDICDEMGLIVQTEIPWVNICGVNAQQEYFDNLHQQMKEMVKSLYNHPSIAFWGMWNELDTWSNNDNYQGVLDTKKVLEQTASLYDLAKSLDPYRFVGVTDDSVINRDGYPTLKADYISENRYNGWYYGAFGGLTHDMNKVHDAGIITNISEYGAGVNPYCQTWNPENINNKDNAKHYEQWGNLFHESHLTQIEQMPWLNFTSIWILFDFPVASRKEGYLNSNDGVNFVESEDRMYTNDKGLVTRDRKLKKDAFYLYKSKWNKEEKTVHIAGKRLEYAPEGFEYEVKVYSNAKTLTLYKGSQKLQTLEGSGEITGVIWKFNPVKLEGESTTFKVVSDAGVEDTITLKKLAQ